MNRLNNQQPTTIFKANLSQSQRGYTYLYSFKSFMLYSNSVHSPSDILGQRGKFIKGNLSKSLNLRLNVSDSDELRHFKIKCILIYLRRFKSIIQTNRYINLKNRLNTMRRYKTLFNTRKKGENKQE